MSKSEAVEVVACWGWREPARIGADGKVVPGKWHDDEETEVPRASLGPRRLTVWLPRGQRIHCRRGLPNNPEHKDDRADKFYHFYGFTERKRIVFTIKGAQ